MGENLEEKAGFEELLTISKSLRLDLRFYTFYTPPPHRLAMMKF